MFCFILAFVAEGVKIQPSVDETYKCSTCIVTKIVGEDQGESG